MQTDPASPLARKTARDHGIDLGSIQGTGPGGRIVRADVLRALEEIQAAPQVPAPEMEAPSAEMPAREGV
ncbi:MAG TPA: hypothetical protein EYP17_01060 [Candidatus Latescibacteria bacterium]|nr:hypothetical protein [Candidatus Latescibacterota bacterium]